ncbi:MAG: hypothetical protein JSS11_12130 [Verrucomicrobia bacterium]|nr:hypothetical protein [Verrucomicrobiota bacterium]
MKQITPCAAMIGLLLVSACSSGPTSARDDYANPTFANPAAKRAARETEIRKLYPMLSDKQIQQKLDGEFPPGVKR